MERSVLSSAVKTYGGKNRYSRSSYSYRPSGLIGSCQNIFEDDDHISAFDRLLNEDQTKHTFVKATPLKSTFNGTVNTLKTGKFQSREDQRSHALKNVQNVRNNSIEPTKSFSVQRFHKEVNSLANKENTIKCRNQLFVSDSDSSEKEENDEFAHEKTECKKNATTTKKKKKDLVSLKTTSRVINQANKRQRRLQLREKFKNNNSSLRNSEASKYPFVKLLIDEYKIPTHLNAHLPRKSILSLAKLSDEEITETENLGSTFKSIFEEFPIFVDELKNSNEPNSIPKDSSTDYVSDNSTYATNNTSSLRLSPKQDRNSFMDHFRPVQISTPRQSAKYDFKISVSSPIHGKALNRSESKEFDPENLSESFQFIKSRLSNRCKKTSLCEAFEKSCSLITKLSENIHILEKKEQSCGSPHRKVVNLSGSVGAEAEKANVSVETNLMDSKNSSCNVSSHQSNFQILSAIDSVKEAQKNDETDSLYMSVESSFSADHSEGNGTVEMKSVVLLDSNCERNGSREISSDSLKPCSPKSNTSSDFSDSADDEYETMIQRAEVTKSAVSETNRNSAYVDSLLLSILHPSTSKSSVESESLHSSVTSHHPLTEPSFPSTSFSSPSNGRSSVATASIRSSVASSPDITQSSPLKMVPTTKLNLGNASNGSYAAAHVSLSESSVNMSLTSLGSDSSDSGELTLTILEKTQAATNALADEVSSPDFIGFETTPVGIAKLAAFRAEIDRLQNKSPSPTLSPMSQRSSLSNDSGIGDTRKVDKSILRSIERDVMSYSRRRSSATLRKESIIRSRKSVAFDAISKFEPLLEEKAEDSPENEKEADCCESTKQQELTVHHLPNRNNFTDRRRRQRCPLPTLCEAEAEIDEGFASSQNSTVNRVSSVREENQTFIRSPLFLAKGKKWRRSLLMLRNVRDFGFNPNLSDEENKGRCWRPNMEHLIQSLVDVTVLSRELDECTVLRTGFDGKTTSGFEEGDTLTEKSIYSRRTLFSQSICVDPSRRHEIAENSRFDESSLARLALESRESFLTDANVSAGDHFRNCSLPRIDFSIPYSARDTVLRYCRQSQPLPFDECFDESVLRSCKKIGEGVYGEVFSLKTRSKSSVIKIIPIEGDQKVNGEKQKNFDEILPELVISLHLSNLRNRDDYYTNCFAKVQRCWCVQGRYPTRLISLWNEYDQEKGSDNDSPKIFKDDQLYLILELNYGGEDLESFEFNNAQQALSVLKQVANALAVAEQAFQFEHRDLHWGNVLISPTKDRESSFIFGDKTRNVQLFGVKVTIIDYTLSRIYANNGIVYTNIGADPELFTAEGDFQFEVYRLMRKEVNDVWDRYVPKTNVIWLYYLIDKMINEVRYRRDYTKIHQTNVEKLKRLHACVLKYESSCDLVENQPI